MPEGIEVFWLLLASHEVTKKKGQTQASLYRRSKQAQTKYQWVLVGVVVIFLGQVTSQWLSLGNPACLTDGSVPPIVMKVAVTWSNSRASATQQSHHG